MIWGYSVYVFEQELRNHFLIFYETTGGLHVETVSRARVVNRDPVDIWDEENGEFLQADRYSVMPGMVA